MAPPTNLFNTGLALVSVSFNRGTAVQINGVPPPWFTPQQGYPAPGWDPGGPSPGNVGPGTNLVSVQTGGMVLPALSLQLPNESPGAIETYVIWSCDPKTLAAQLAVAVLDSGRLLATDSVTGEAVPVSS